MRLFWNACVRGGSTVLLLVLGASLSTAPAAEAGKKADAGYRLPQVETINQALHRGWQENELTPSKPATDGEWCRRVYLDIVGRIPSVEELEWFLKNRSENKKAELVNKLLGDQYVEEYARHWTTIWTNILIGRTGGTDDDSLTSREGMKQYLRRALQHNKPYDQMVYELVTAAGTTTPGSPKFNGATNYLVDKYADKGVLATAKTAQIFLGLQVQCTQCHNHPFNDWKQNSFWELNAFFRQSRPIKTYSGGEVATVALVDETFAGEGGNPANAEIYYELRNGLVKVAYPVFVDGTSLVDLKGEAIGNSGYLEDVNRRQELGKLMIKSEYLQKAIVNRYWGRLLGYGFTKPVDDMGPHNPAVYPDLLASLGKELRKNSFNLKELIRWITLSEAYGLSSKLNSSNVKDDPALGARPMFSHFYMRQMEAEQLYESLLVATQAQKTAGSYKEQQKIKQKWLSQFATAFGTDEGDEMTTFNGTIPQTLMMMNGDLIKKATDGEPGSFLYTVAHNAKWSNPTKIKYLYLAALSRMPDSRELRVANQLLAWREGKVVEALQDVWWVLLNSNEFILIH